MKVLHFHFGKDGGAEGFFVHLINGLAKCGVEQKAIIRPNRSWRPSIAQAADIPYESHFRNTNPNRLLLPLRTQRLIKQWKPDAVFAWMSRAGHLLPSNCDCLRFGRLGDYPDRLTQFKHADVLICNTPGIVGRVRKLGWTKRVEVVTNFTCTDQVAPISRSELDTPEGAPLVCTAGRMVHRKGFDTVVKAIAELPETYLWIVGDGSESANIHQLVNDLGLNDRVRFAGWQDDPRPYIAAADVFAMASRHEPLGNVILEGWAQKVPVVATRSEGPTWLIQDGKNGLLADIENHLQFAESIESALVDPNLASTIVSGGATSLQGQFSEQAVVDRYIQVLGGKTVVPMAA